MATTSILGARLEESRTQADAVANVITLEEMVEAIEIYHEEANTQVFTVNGLSINVAAGGWARLIAGTPSTEVTIPAGVDCIVNRLV